MYHSNSKYYAVQNDSVLIALIHSFVIVEMSYSQVNFKIKEHTNIPRKHPSSPAFHFETNIAKYPNIPPGFKFATVGQS